LHVGPNDGQATGFGREGIDLIGALPEEAAYQFAVCAKMKEAFFTVSSGEGMAPS
jgi:hypothetical protein